MKGTRPAWLLEEAFIVDSIDGLKGILSDGDGPYLPTGMKSGLRRGAAPTRPVTPLELTGLNRILDHAHEDLTVRVEAGVSLGELESILGERNQWLPPGSFGGGAGTVGGLIGTDWRSPLCAGSGSLRDYLIGVTFADGGGRLVRAGGRVVKNVAGYDLMKMLIGSLGELGVVGEAVLRVVPRPECWEGVMLRHPEPELLAHALEASCEWFPAGLWRGDLGEGERLWAVFGGATSRVRSQVARAREAWGDGACVLGQEETLALLAEVTRICRPGEMHGWGGALASFLHGWSPVPGVRWISDLLGGHLWMDFGEPRFEEMSRIREELRGGEGHLHLDLPDGFNGGPVWGRVPEGELSLWRGLKKTLDPDQRLARGRLPGGV